MVLFCVSFGFALVGAWRALRLQPAEVVEVQAPPTGARLIVTVQVVDALPVADAGAATPASPPVAVAEATVVVVGESPDREFAELMRNTTRADGTVEFAGLPEGPVWVLAEAKGKSRRSARVLLAGEQRLQLVLTPAQTLNVTVLDDQRAPIKQATVLVSDSDALPFGALTAADGTARFDRLGPAPYGIKVYARGYESVERAGVTDDVQIVLRRLGGLGVTVVSAKGEPASEAEVYVVGSSLWPARRLQTDAQGKAHLGGLLSGVYDLRARKGGLVSEVLSGVRLERGERRDVELRLGVGRMVRVKVVSAAPEKRPIEGAAIVLAEFGLSPFPITARSGKDGFAAVGPLAPGPAFLSVRADGYIGRGAIAVPEMLTEPLEVQLQKGATLKGKVVDEHDHAIAGASVEIIGIDTDGLPIDETPLRAAYREAHFDFAMKPLPLIPAGELGVTMGHVPFVNEAEASRSSLGGWTELPSDYRPWQSDVDGRFRAHPIPPGKVRALVRHPDYVEGLSETVVLGPGGEREVTVVLAEGGRLLGRVVDERGHPVASARVLLASNTGSFERNVYSARDGTFEVKAVPEHVTVSLARPDDPSRFVWKGPLRISEHKEREVEFELPAPRADIEWRVLDEDDKPIDLAQVTLLSLEESVPLRLTQFTREDGRIHVPDAAGLQLRVTARAPGYVSWSEQFAKAPSERVIVLRRGLRVAGKVTAVRGRQEVAGARVTLLTDLRKDSTTTDVRGGYGFTQVPRGKIEIRVEHGDYARVTEVFAVKDTGREDRAFELPDIDLQEGVTISGVVTNADEQPVAGAKVGVGFVASITKRGALPAGVVLTDDRGRFTLRGVQPGAVRVSAVGPTGDRGDAELSAEPGDEKADVDIALAPADGESEVDVHTAGLAVTFGERDAAGGVEVVVVDVVADSEAERGGLLRGDVVKRVGGQRAGSMRVARSLTRGRAGSDVIVDVRRGGRTLSFRIRREELTGAD